MNMPLPDTEISNASIEDSNTLDSNDTTNIQHSDVAIDEPVIQVRDLGKMYKLYPKTSAILREVIFHKKTYDEFWALRNVNFDIHEGEIVGIVGANGAGKSTLLSILAGVLDSSEGAFHINGKLRAIFQLGTGFHDEYTGYDNIYMGAYCLGYSKAEIEESIDWIIDFSGLKDAIHRPFRTYSSGMKARLSFSVTFCRKPKVMIIDEALSAGDIAFQQKCIARIIELCSGGATALIVSHSMFFIEKLCKRAIYIKDGILAADGDCRPITQKYERELLGQYAKTQVNPKTSTNKSTNTTTSNANVIESKPQSKNQAHKILASSDQELHDSQLPIAHTTFDPKIYAPTLADSNDLDDETTPPLDPEIQVLLDDPESLCPPILHLELVRLLSVRILDGSNIRCDMFHTGDTLTVEIELESWIHKDGIVIGLQIFHESNVHVSTTTNLVQVDNAGNPYQTPLNLRRGRQVFRVTFPRLFLADGKYFISIGISPKPKHFTESDQLLREKRIAVFGFHRSDIPWKVLYDPPTAWSKVQPKVQTTNNTHQFGLPPTLAPDTEQPPV